MSGKILSSPLMCRLRCQGWISCPERTPWKRFFSFNALMFLSKSVPIPWMPRAQCLPDVTRTVLHHRGCLSFLEESFVSRNSGPTAAQTPHPSWGSPGRLWAGLFLLPCFQMAETNLFFVLFSGWRCPSKKLRTHLFWGINQNLPPSSQEPTADVLPLRSPACLLQEGNLTSQAQMLPITMLKNLNECPLYAFVSLTLTGITCASGTEIFTCISCSLFFDVLVCSVHLTAATSYRN